eukprot:6785372-Pyramimonas_sp.AAC.1
MQASGAESGDWRHPVWQGLTDTIASHAADVQDVQVTRQSFMRESPGRHETFVSRSSEWHERVRMGIRMGSSRR